jgi:hypothetical protein
VEVVEEKIVELVPKKKYYVVCGDTLGKDEEFTP